MSSPDVLVLNFHGIGRARPGLPDSEQKVWITEAQFKSMLDAVANQAAVHLTFDDGNVSDLEVALPALQARGMKAQFFIVAGRIGQSGYLSEGQVKELLAAGMAIGNHGMQHRRWAGLSSDDLSEELIESRERLENLTGSPIRHAACPFGSYDRRVLRALRRGGYTRVYTSDCTRAGGRKWVWSRYSIHHDWNAETIQRLIARNPGPLARLRDGLRLLIKQYR